MSPINGVKKYILPTVSFKFSQRAGFKNSFKVLSQAEENLSESLSLNTGKTIRLLSVELVTEDDYISCILLKSV